MTQGLQYKPNGDNSFLRYALWKFWGRACYWCGCPLEDSTYAEIDHILPRDGFDNHYKKYVQGRSFSVHSAENLAPICAAGRKCNQRKLNKLPAGADGAICGALDTASKHAPDVRRMQSSISRVQGVEKAIVSVVSGDLTKRVRDLLKKYGEDLIRRLHALDPGVPETYLLKEQIDGNFDPGVDHVDGHSFSLYSIALDQRGRFIFQTSLQLFQVDLAKTIGESIDRVIERVEEQLEAATPASDSNYQNRSCLSRSPYGYLLDLTQQHYEIIPTQAVIAEMTLTGEGAVTASTVRDNEDGEPVETAVEWEVQFSAQLCIRVDANGATPTISDIRACISP